MIEQGLDLHGIQELVDINRYPIFSRYPQSINDAIGNQVSMQVISQEIRFVPLSDCATTIGSHSSSFQNKCLIFYGDYASPEEFIFHKEITLSISFQKVFRSQDDTPPPPLEKPYSFSNKVVRIILLGENFFLKKINGNYRLPKKTTFLWNQYHPGVKCNKSRSDIPLFIS